MYAATADFFKPLQALKQSIAISHGTPLPHMNAATVLTLLTLGDLMNISRIMYVGHVSICPMISSTADRGSMMKLKKCR